ncbi:hypothetical protein Tco_0565596 [Tanacetum coccineum]
MLDLSRCWKRLDPLLTSLSSPQELSRVHNTFHVSNLKKCYSDEPLAVPLEGLHVDDKLRFMEEPVEIMDREVKRLKQSRKITVVTLVEELCPRGKDLFTILAFTRRKLMVHDMEIMALEAT